MNPTPINLATEDELSEVVLRQILKYVGGYSVGTCYRRGGFGYLKQMLPGWNHAAQGVPFVVLTDLDTHPCPAALLGSWHSVPRHPNLVFRVAVREVEAWLLADRANFARFLSLPVGLIPVESDSLDDPKASLVRLAAQSRPNTLRERLVPRRGSTAKQGPDYNSCLSEFVRKYWDLGAAAKMSPSLSRALSRLKTFTPTWP